MSLGSYGLRTERYESNFLLLPPQKTVICSSPSSLFSASGVYRETIQLLFNSFNVKYLQFEQTLLLSL